MQNHYQWCEEHLNTFLGRMGKHINYIPGLLSAHGDKAYGYRNQWERKGIPFNHGVAIYLLSYLDPWNDESRNTINGWVPVEKWVADNYERFRKHLPEA